LKQSYLTLIHHPSGPQPPQLQKPLGICGPFAFVLVLEEAAALAESQAKPATDSLKRTRLFVTDYVVKVHYPNRCASIVKPDDEIAVMGQPPFAAAEHYVRVSWTRAVAVCVVAGRTAHRANDFLSRHTLLDLFEPFPRYARTASDKQPAGEARQQGRSKQQSTEKAATGHGDNSQAKPATNSPSERRRINFINPNPGNPISIIEDNRQASVITKPHFAVDNISDWKEARGVA
jgi:hypothetical protein